MPVKITLLAINAKYLHSSLAVWYLLGGLKKYAKKQHDTTVIEATINQSIESIIDRIVNSKPNVVGISTYIWNANVVISIIKQLKLILPETIILLGGPEASHNATFWLNQSADFVMYGDGEYDIATFIDALGDKNEEAIKNIPGIYYISDNKICFTPKKSVMNEYINPYSEEYFSSLKGSLSYIESSRGCPFSCSYCLSSNDSIRLFPIEEIKHHLAELVESGTQTIKFVDRTFNCHLVRAKEITRYILSLETDCCFHFEVAADLFDEELLNLLISAPKGRIKLEIGLQSFNEDTLKAVSRVTNQQKAEENIRYLLQNQNIHIHVDLIAGLPYETLETFIEGFNRAYQIGAHTLQLGFLKMLYGSRLREQAVEYDIQYTEKPPYEVTNTQWLSGDDIQILKKTENALQNTYNKGRFLETLRYVLDASKLTPFTLYHQMGSVVPHHAIYLEDYLEQLYYFLASLKNVDINLLRDNIICDMLRMTKGKSIPKLLRSYGEQRKKTATIARQILGRNIDYDEVEVIGSNIGIYVDGSIKDSVTGLYSIGHITL